MYAIIKYSGSQLVVRGAPMVRGLISSGPRRRYVLRSRSAPSVELETTDLALRRRAHFDLPWFSSPDKCRSKKGSTRSNKRACSFWTLVLGWTNRHTPRRRPRKNSNRPIPTTSVFRNRVFSRLKHKQTSNYHTVGRKSIFVSINDRLRSI